KKVRVVLVHDRQTGLKLLANLAWFVRSPNGQIDAYLEKDVADKVAQKVGGSVVNFANTFSSTTTVASR
ncbi:MAG: nitrate ABC transporter substrate-binding protein, partial [Dechloromonas sp.]|nr:nitrate ABC transporter substrate-binding protein [Dechloromonas sp.]